MSGRHDREHRRLTRTMAIRLRPDEHERLRAEAEAAGLSLAALIRRLLTPVERACGGSATSRP